MSHGCKSYSIYVDRKTNTLFAYLEIEDNTVPTLDAATLEADPTIIGELYRELKPILENGTAKERTAAARALRIGIAALKGEDIPL